MKTFATLQFENLSTSIAWPCKHNALKTTSETNFKSKINGKTSVGQPRIKRLDNIKDLGWKRLGNAKCCLCWRSRDEAALPRYKLEHSITKLYKRDDQVSSVLTY